MHKKRLVIAIALAALSLAACNDGTTTSGKATSESSSATSSSKAQSKPEPASGSSAGEVTAPGTTLSVGDTATVPYKSGKKEGTVGITVSAIEQGDPADLAEFGDKAAGFTPYFIRVKVENAGGTDLSFTSLSVAGRLTGGKATGAVLIGEVKGKCEKESAPKDFTTTGASYETCALAASKGDPVTEAQFSESDDYKKSPITWTK